MLRTPAVYSCLALASLSSTARSNPTRLAKAHACACALTHTLPFHPPHLSSYHCFSYTRPTYTRGVYCIETLKFVCSVSVSLLRTIFLQHTPHHKITRGTRVSHPEYVLRKPRPQNTVTNFYPTPGQKEQENINKKTNHHQSTRLRVD